MQEFKSRSKYRTRTVRSITRTTPPIICKHFIDIQVDEKGHSYGENKRYQQSNTLKLYDTTLDHIIRKLKKNQKSQDILLVVTPASKHPNLCKLHVIQRQQQGHLGMISVKQKELANLRSSRAFYKYCIVFASQYIDLKTVVFKTETIQNLASTVNKKCCPVVKIIDPKRLKNENQLKSYTSSAGDYCVKQLKTVLKYQDNMEAADNISFTVSDILILIDTIKNSLEPSKDLHRFFSLADKLKLSLVIRPDMFCKSSPVLNQQNLPNFYVECYMPGNSHIGTIPINNVDLLHYLELHPNVLYHIHVINDIFDIIPLRKMLVAVLQKLFYFLRMELFYDAIGELLFDWYRNFTYI